MEARLMECQTTLALYAATPTVFTVEEHSHACFSLAAFLFHRLPSTKTKEVSYSPYQMVNDTRDFIHLHGLQMSLSYAMDLAMVIMECPDYAHKSCQEWIQEAITIFTTNRNFGQTSLASIKRYEYIKSLQRIHIKQKILS